MTYLAEIKPRYGVGYITNIIQSEDDDKAVEQAKSLVLYGQRLLRVSEVVGNVKGKVVWEEQR